jgi:phytoene dehydrogenase-like protein
MALATYLFSAWRLACTGADFAGILAARFRELGGTLVLDDEVKKILVSSRIVEGVELKSGNRIIAPLVVSTVHPKIMLGMLQEDAAKPSYKLRVGKLQNTEGIFSVNLAVDAKECGDLPHNIFKVASDSTGTMTDATFIQVRKTHDPQKNLLTLLCGSKYEKWKQWEHTVTGRRGAEYEGRKEEESGLLVKQASGVLGPISGARIIDSYTPLTVRDWVNSPCGSPYGIKKSVGQMMSGPSLNRTSIKGLYLAGQSIQAPGIVGTVLGSLSTVKLIIGHEPFRGKFAGLT